MACVTCLSLNSYTRAHSCEYVAMSHSPKELVRGCIRATPVTLLLLLSHSCHTDVRETLVTLTLELRVSHTVSRGTHMCDVTVTCVTLVLRMSHTQGGKEVTKWVCLAQLCGHVTLDSVPLYTHLSCIMGDPFLCVMSHSHVTHVTLITHSLAHSLAHSLSRSLASLLSRALSLSHTHTHTHTHTLTIACDQAVLGFLAVRNLPMA